MVGKFIVLSERQADWMKNVVKNMIKLTAYYSFAKQPLKERDYENIVGVFSNYTEKSRNNAMVIRCATALTEYLDGLTMERTLTLDEVQMQKMEDAVGELMQTAVENQKNVWTESEQTKVGGIIDSCCTEAGDHKLWKELKGVFEEYVIFCMKENADRAQNLTETKKCADGKPRQMKVR